MKRIFSIVKSVEFQVYCIISGVLSGMTYAPNGNADGFSKRFFGGMLIGPVAVPVLAVKGAYEIIKDVNQK